ncbi:hypothetical protein EDB81DRAFT_697527 [Dactylonectria macrodidyma]|uniref:Uncharacterized protein n=1 Tax=Dactylonectria macrodidyma TaxID=307937 RepID=A0A9P9IQB9_9HYPO|nr:hypothetical protein EDB81DRAFT_697527 [Dactylonectria macrodidyma]
MANRLLSLPYELRDSIWSFAISTSSCNALAGCCHQTRNEFRPLSEFPHGVRELISLRFWVDSSYVNGGWLKLHYTWAEGSKTYQKVSVITNLRDDELYRFLEEIRHVSYFEIHLVAPRRGHFVGALLMMLAKIQDAYRIILAVSPQCRYSKKVKAYRIVSPFALVFRTEDGADLKSTPFWECRAPKDLGNPISERDPDWGSSPFFYEYFMANLPRCFKIEPKFRFGIWPRRHVSTFGPGPRDIVGIRPGHGRRRKHKGRDGLALFVSEEAVRMSKLPGWDAKQDPGVGTGHRYEYISADAASLASRAHLLIDTLVGPVGGPLDMLRLHRFKEMDTEVPESGRDLLFRHVLANTVPDEKLSLTGTVTRRLRNLFNPFAPADIREARSACPHLAQVEWSQNMILPRDVSSICPRDMWLQFYPNGIRHAWRARKGGSLVEWRRQVRVMACRRRPDRALITWLYDCVCCCEASFEGWAKVSPKVALKDRCCGWKFFRSKSHNTSVPSSCCCLECGDASRPVMVYNSCSGLISLETGVATNETGSFHLRLSPKCKVLDMARRTWTSPESKRNRWTSMHESSCCHIFGTRSKNGIRRDTYETEPPLGFCCWWHV